MSRVHCFTSITFSYLAKARVLAWSLKRFHPDWVLWVVISDREPPGFRFSIADEPFDRVLWADELPIDRLKGWLFKHDVVEVCTAVKGPALELLTASDADKILYLDPDIAVMGPLDSIVSLLDHHDIVLTPHLLHQNDEAGAIEDNEICSLQHGIYNLGFIAIRNGGEGKRFARWWGERLKHYCYDDIPSGLFVDQRWCDLVPALFDNVHILRDPGCNVASWNINHRRIDITLGGEVLADGSPLKFYHFTKIDGSGYGMTARYAGDNIHVFELVHWYRSHVQKFSEPALAQDWWHYGTYADGFTILRAHRLLYRTREDLQRMFPDPFASGTKGFRSWLEQHRCEWDRA